MAKIATCLRSGPKGWELDRYVFFSCWHIYLMFLISVLPNLEGKKYIFGDVTLTRTVPIWGVLPICELPTTLILESDTQLVFTQANITQLPALKFTWISQTDKKGKENSSYNIISKTLFSSGWPNPSSVPAGLMYWLQPRKSFRIIWYKLFLSGHNMKWKRQSPPYLSVNAGFYHIPSNP